MNFYDQHCHTHLSFDSEESIDNYLALGLEKLTFTEHLDLDNPVSGGDDDIPDFEQAVLWQQEMKEKNDVDLLLGVEVGYVPGQEDRLNEILSSYDFDIKLLSCHHNRIYDYMDTKETNAKVESSEQMMDQYVDQLLEAVTHMTDVQIMTHFDYGFRVHDASLETIQERYTEKITEIFQQIIKHEIAFELNSKSIVKYKNLDLYKWAIPLYLSLGGKLFTLGSDAHLASDYMLAFNDLRKLLQQYGVDEVALYEKEQAKMVKLSELSFV